MVLITNNRKISKLPEITNVKLITHRVCKNRGQVSYVNLTCYYFTIEVKVRNLHLTTLRRVIILSCREPRSKSTSKFSSTTKLPVNYFEFCRCLCQARKNNLNN